MRRSLGTVAALALALLTAACAGAAAEGAGAHHGPAPGDLLDLSRWKLQLPVAGDGSEVLEISQPQLRRYSFHPYFHLDDAGRTVIFRAHAGGVTTAHSHYPRSELREMTEDGKRAAWSTTEGTHTMTVVQSINAVPDTRPHVVAGQIHDGTTDLVMVRLEDKKLFVQGDGKNLGTLEPRYQLGTRFTVRLTASNGRVRVYYNDLATPKVDVERAAPNCYFKAGVYTQTNRSRGDLPDAYGEVGITSLAVTHE